MHKKLSVDENLLNQLVQFFIFAFLHINENDENESMMINGAYKEVSKFNPMKCSRKRNKSSRNPTQGSQNISKPDYLNSNPTAENIALHLKDKIFPNLFKEGNFIITKVRLYETPNCFVEV